MKRTLYNVACYCFLACAAAGTAFAQMPEAGVAGGNEVSKEQFTEMKTRVLSRIEERGRRLQEEKACVEAAANITELRKCRPQPADFMRGLGQAKQHQGDPK